MAGLVDAPAPEVLAETKGQPHELLVTALVRARLCELLAKQDPAAEPDRAFTTGLFSVADALLHTPLPQLLDDLPFDGRLTGALLRHEGPEGRLLHAILAYERGHFAAAGRQHDLRAFSHAYYDAVAWATETVAALR